MKIGIIGGGISGLTAAHLLHDKHDIELLEAGEKLGGHTNTETVSTQGEVQRINTGFIVFNEKNYPNFLKILKRLNVAYEPTSMSFSVKCLKTGLEYGFASLDALFAQRRNVFSPSFIRMLLDIRRFRREFENLLSGDHDKDELLGSYLSKKGYSKAFVDQFLVPFGAAIWSAGADGMNAFPLHTFVSFFKNHGFLSLDDLLPWQTISGGSDRYIEPLIAPFRSNVFINTRVEQIRRSADNKVSVSTSDGSTRIYDRVILATHSDQTLAVLADPSPAEHSILSSMLYQPNDVVLHRDISIMPRHRQTWSSWNYCIPKNNSALCTVTYDMNILQNLSTDTEFLVTLNQSGVIDPDSIIKQFNYDHPVYTRDSINSQNRYSEINGVDRLHFAGAYWGYGFHEDGVNSAIAACKPLGGTL